MPRGDRNKQTKITKFEGKKKKKKKVKTKISFSLEDTVMFFLLGLDESLGQTLPGLA